MVLSNVLRRNKLSRSGPPVLGGGQYGADPTGFGCCTQEVAGVGEPQEHKQIYPQPAGGDRPYESHSSALGSPQMLQMTFNFFSDLSGKRVKRPLTGLNQVLLFPIVDPK